MADSNPVVINYKIYIQWIIKDIEWILTTYKFQAKSLFLEKINKSLTYDFLWGSCKASGSLPCVRQSKITSEEQPVSCIRSLFTPGSWAQGPGLMGSAGCWMWWDISPQSPAGWNVYSWVTSIQGAQPGVCPWASDAPHFLSVWLRVGVKLLILNS